MQRGLSPRTLGLLVALFLLVGSVAASAALGARWVRTRVGGIQLVYDEWGTDASNVRFAMEAGLRRLGSFGSLVKGSQVVLMADHASLEAALGTELCPLTVAVTQDSCHVLVQRPSTWPTEIASVMPLPTLLAHELSHIAVTRESAGRAPLWLQEGIAAYLAGDYDPTLLALADLEVVTLGTVEAHLATPSPDQTNGALAYQLAGGAVWTLVEEMESEQGLHQLLQSLAAGRTLDQSLQRELGYDAAEFERRWRAALRRDEMRAMSETAEVRLVEKAASRH